MNHTTDFHEGLNHPSPVTRVLILGYYDGATHGVLQLGEKGLVYRFDYRDDRPNPTGLDERQFELRPLPDDALDRLENVIGEHLAPNWPTWLPLWKFASSDIEQSVRGQVDAILDLAGPAEWQMVTGDTVRFATLTAQSLARERAIAG